MSGRVRVLVYVTAPADDPRAVDTAYHAISEALAGTPGLLGNELLRSATDASACVVASEWESMEAFRAWEQGPAHRGTTAPLRPYLDGRGGPSFAVYEVAAAY